MRIRYSRRATKDLASIREYLSIFRGLFAAASLKRNAEHAEVIQFDRSSPLVRVACRHPWLLDLDQHWSRSLN
jgi:hypothetical protein